MFWPAFAFRYARHLARVSSERTRLTVVAVGHDDEPLAAMGIAGAARAEDSCRNAVTHVLQWADECRELSRSVPRDVFAEETRRPHGAHNPEDVRNEEAGIVGAEPFAGDAVSLAWIAGSDAMNAATPRAAIEGGKVAPDRCRMKPPRVHRRNQACRSSGFPLHVTDPASIASAKVLAKEDAEFKPSDAGAQSKDGSDGTYSHVM